MTKKHAPESAARRARDIRAEIMRADRLYYVEADPELPDREYDALLQELAELEADYPDLVNPHSPTQRVGGETVDGFDKVVHASPMLSLENVFSLDEIIKWYDKCTKAYGGNVLLAVEPKLDGAALAMHYLDNKLRLAVTRGDGTTGDDVSSNAATIRNVPLTLSAAVDYGISLSALEVRGEVVMLSKDFQRVNADMTAAGRDPLKNPRNGAAGALRQSDPQKCRERRLTFVAHGVAALQHAPGCRRQVISTYGQQVHLLKALGVPTAPLGRYGMTLDQALLYVEELPESIFTIGMETDGIVLKVDNLDAQRKLGEGRKHPKWAVAFKWDRYEAETTVNAITYQVGKTGAITPVAELETVEIAGTSVSRASLFNYEEMRRLDIRVGDTVIVEKAGKIIPHVLRVDLTKRKPNVRPPRFPTTCPCCHWPVNVEDGVVVRTCSNPNCPEVFKRVLETFASKDRLDIAQMGPAITDQLVDREIVMRLPELFDVTEEMFQQLDKVGAKKAKSLVAAVEAAKQQPLWRVIAGLNIPMVGRTISQVLVDTYQTMDNVLTASRNATKLAKTAEIGEVAAAALYVFIWNDGGKELIEALATCGLNMGTEDTGPQVEQTLAGKSIVVTGTLSDFSREESREAIRERGGKFGSSVSKKTDYLVFGLNAGSKYDKAEQLGVPILTEDDFKDLLEGNYVE